MDNLFVLCARSHVMKVCFKILDMLYITVFYFGGYAYNSPQQIKSVSMIENGHRHTKCHI